MAAILIVDDVVENIRLLKSLLADLGQILFARDGAAAIAQAELHRPDLILLDVMMPGIDGHETCRRLKQAAGTRDIPILFVTAASSDGDEAAGLALGAIDYITKPFCPEIVRARVRNQLALVAARNELRQANAAMRKFKAAIESSSAGIMITDAQARIEYVNPAFVELTGYSAQEALGQSAALLKSGDTPPATYEELWQTVQGGASWRGELRNRRKDGTLLWQDIAIAPVHDPELGTTHFVSVNSDISQRKQMEEELRQLATTDVLTGIANRRRLFEVGERELARARRSDQALTVLMIDIDHFKRINDSFGHPAGDLVIQAAARLCADGLREIDTAGRCGGEEFVMILPGTDLAGALQVGERLRAMAEACAVAAGDDALRFTVSVGAARLEPRHQDFAALLGMADQALYRAKQEGRNRVIAIPGEEES
ncbi:MAG: diguanylate cyclase [Pseudomonadota bacterium]